MNLHLMSLIIAGTKQLQWPDSWMLCLWATTLAWLKPDDSVCFTVFPDTMTLTQVEVWPLNLISFICGVIIINSTAKDMTGSKVVIMTIDWTYWSSVQNTKNNEKDSRCSWCVVFTVQEVFDLRRSFSCKFPSRNSVHTVPTSVTRANTALTS